MRAASILVSLLAVSAIGCWSAEAPVNEGPRYVLPKASGAQLGMTLSALRAARPGVFRDSDGWIERLDSGLTNGYHFGSNGNLEGITVSLLVREAERERHEDFVRQVHALWSRPGTAIPDSIVRSASTPNGDQFNVTYWIWRRDDLRLVLIRESERLGRLFAQATVARAGVPLSAVSPWLQEP